MADSYSKAGKVSSDTIREMFADAGKIDGTPLAHAFNFIDEVVRAFGPSAFSLNYHPDGQLVVLLYPGQPDALS